MSKFLLITKINILQMFSLTKNNNSKYKNERHKKTLKTIGFIAIICYIMGYIFYYAKTLLPIFISTGKPLYMIVLLFLTCTIYIFFSNLFRIKSVLFDFKDYDLLMSLPITRKSVILSKIVSLYVINLIYTLIIMLPGYLAFILETDMPYDIMFFLLLLTIPLIPLLASSIIGIFLTWIISFFHNKNIGSYIVNISIIFIVFFISFKTSSLNNVDMVNKSINMVDSFGRYYPLMSIFVSILENIDVINLLIYFSLPIILMLLFVLIINQWYIPLRTSLLKQNIKSDYEIKQYKNKGPLKSLYLKELKKYFSNSMYVINTSFGCIIVIVLIASMLLSNNNILNQFSEIGDIKEMITNNIFLVLSMICVVSSTTHASISLEGKSLWIMKSIPICPDSIYLSKILVNFTILIPTVILGGTFFGLYLHLSIEKTILLYLLPLLYSVFISILGLLFNLLFPKFDFDNEIRVIKQSLPVFLTMLVGIMMVIIPFGLLNDNVELIIGLMIFIDMMLIIMLRYYGRRRFIEL